MPRGDKSKYTGQQERKADHIAKSYESRGVPEKEVERRAMSENYLLCRLRVGLTETPRLRSMNTLRAFISGPKSDRRPAGPASSSSGARGKGRIKKAS